MRGNAVSPLSASLGCSWTLRDVKDECQKNCRILLMRGNAVSPLSAALQFEFLFLVESCLLSKDECENDCREDLGNFYTCGKDSAWLESY